MKPAQPLVRLAAAAAAAWAAFLLASAWPIRRAGAQGEGYATRIVINVPEHRLYLYVGRRLFHSYPVAVGKPETPTPRGEFVITQKAIWGDGFGTRWMRFSAPWGIYGIHGTNKPWSVGTVASHGCVRMYNHDVEQVFALVKLGTPVDIVGLTPYAPIRRPVDPGDIGEDVVELQRLLRLAGTYHGRLTGVFRNGTAEAVRAFQARAGLPVTGVADARTVEALQQATGQAGRRPGYLPARTGVAPRPGGLRRAEGPGASGETLEAARPDSYNG
ncbi:conserved protein of unknown function [Candidatus Hydrogenisulfobacillus filiaventi]|uniref:L,D-TPase catalytic domain-containing protein n=1 Tax=Candidatus Hydrogenisulfobacillus filiaventi TaxID=2707344 RepID=A0A6F8ZJY6_9FIRM|nr:conserved protein of unknown function [Candidatus Hydrogenisulfobacillus filiaventi]